MAETTVVAPAMASNVSGSDMGIPFQSPAPLVTEAIQADAGSADTSRPVFRVPDGDYVGTAGSGFGTVNSAHRIRLTAPPAHAPPEHRRSRPAGDSVPAGPPHPPRLPLDRTRVGRLARSTAPRVGHLARLGLSPAACPDEPAGPVPAADASSSGTQPFGRRSSR
ncbi:hypothetical protein GCM10010327_31710 [Streptomyces nitrosporeus]|nr:hypothetical protein GCM10010327_31710 [Streptomyces nitrosporeus]